ncbi:CPBP family intramembrane glutamic endopeptidase [Kordia sp.]|uniref:CPBP family intramembrane glutamic endopeptidase n=1 Tax=Kordia sp. TaxID=1965332 RepID=UPI003D2CFF86
MTILKAILLTVLYIFTFTLVQLGLSFFFKIEAIPEYLKMHGGMIIIVSFLITYIVLFRLFWKLNFDIKKVLNLKAYKLKFLPYLILIVSGLYLLNRPLLYLGRLWDYYSVGKFETNFNSFTGFNAAFIYHLIITLIIAPILEELFFRKFLLQKLLEKNSQKVSIIISSVCFAIIHIETPYNLIPTFVFGIVSSLIFIKTKKIGYSIFLHFLFNLLVITLQHGYDSIFDKWLLSLHFNSFYWILFLMGIVITYLGTKKVLEN